MPWCHECETEYAAGIQKCPVCGAVLYDEIPPSMLPKPKLGWSFKRRRDVSAEWPTDSKGNNIPSALLTHVGGSQIDCDLVTGVLRAFNIPYACLKPDAGQISALYLGFSSSGTDIYVPETMLEDAINLLKTDSEDRQ